MVIRPDRARFWSGWRRRFLRLGVTIPAALMLTLLLVAVDWGPLRAVHAEWLLNVAFFLLAVLWTAIAFILLAVALIAVALRVDRVELERGRLRRRLIFGRAREVAIDSATLSRGSKSDVVRGGGRRVAVPHLFYAPEDLDRLWGAAGIADEETKATTPPG